MQKKKLKKTSRERREGKMKSGGGKKVKKGKGTILDRGRAPALH